MTEVRASIIVRAFNEEEHIGRLFTGISQQNISDFEVILVDSGSTCLLYTSPSPRDRS